MLGDPVIFSAKDVAEDELEVSAYTATGPVAVISTTHDHSFWLTPEESKRLRKALKAWERSVA